METEGQNEDEDIYHHEDDDISIEHESQDNIYMTIDNMNTIQEMNTAQLHINPEQEKIQQTHYQNCPSELKF